MYHGDCVFERNSLEEIRETLSAHLRDYHGVTEDVEPVFRYQINGIDITDEADVANQARAAAEEADRLHKLARLKFANRLRDQGATMESIAQLLGYQLSTVATFLRDKESKFEKNGE